MKTLKQLLKELEYPYEAYNNPEKQIIGKVKEWLIQKRQKWVDSPNPDMPNWTQRRDAVIMEYDKLLEDLEK